MQKKKKRSLSRILGIFVMLLMLCLSVSVSAEMFSAGEVATVFDEFGAGETVQIPAEPVDDVFGTGTEIEQNETYFPIVDENNNAASGEDSLEGEIVSDQISVEMEGTTTLPEDTETDTEAVVIVFKDQAGGVYADLQMQVKMGETITLPSVPTRENAAGSGWKLNLEEADDVAKVWEAGTAVTVLDSDIELGDKFENNVLTFYAVPGIDPCVVTYYTGDGSKILQQMEVKSGSSIVLPDFPANGYKTLGWAKTVNAKTAIYTVGATCEITSDRTFYLVRTQMVTATFKKRSGTQNAQFRSFGKTVEKGTTIVLPQVPDVVGYQSLGWALKSYANEIVYKCGQTVTLNKNTTFYAVYKNVGKRTVKFTNNNGTSIKTMYTSLNRTVTRLSYFTMPELPKVAGYRGLGWATVKNSKTVVYKPGDIIKVSKNVTFYAVFQKTYKVYLRTKGGTLWRTVEVDSGSYYELPGVRSKNGYTMMGWSSQKSQGKNPEYEVGEKIKISRNTTLYSVLYVRTKETNYTGLELQKLTNGLTSKYKKVIFVGDSRTVRMELTLKNSGYRASTDKVYFVAKSGQGLSWLKSTGYPELLQKVGKKKSLNEKPTAVVFNLGVNDLKNLSKYVTYMKSIAPELESLGCELYYMSVNPVNNTNLKYWGKKERLETDVRNFNATIKSKLCSKTGDYKYIDTYSYLYKYGFGTDAGSEGYDVGKDDGLHYTVKTSKRIFRYCVNILNK